MAVPFDLPAFEKAYNCKVYFESDVVLYNKTNLTCVVVASLAAIAIVFGVMMLCSSEHTLSFLNEVDHRWAWSLIGSGGALLLATAIHGARLIYRHTSFVNEAKSKLGEESEKLGYRGARLGSACHTIYFPKIREAGLDASLSSKKWTCIRLYDENWHWNQGLITSAFLDVKNGVNTITIARQGMCSTKTYLRERAFFRELVKKEQLGQGDLEFVEEYKKGNIL